MKSRLVCTLILLSFSHPAFSQTTNPMPVRIRSADIILKVTDFDAARKTALDLARECGAELSDSQTTVNYQGKKDGWLLFQLDAQELDALTKDLRPVGKLYSEHMQTTDQTSYYEKLGRRVGLLAQNEQELLSFLHRPRQMRGSDILFVQYRLFQSRVEASDAEQEKATLERSAQRSTLRVSLFEPIPNKAFDWGNWRAHGAYRAKTAFLTFAGKLVTSAYFVLWFAPLWIPLGLVVFFVLRWGTRRLMSFRTGRT